MILIIMVGNFQDLTEAMPRISNSIKTGDFNEFDEGVRDASGAVCALTESAAQVSMCGYSRGLLRSARCSITVSIETNPLIDLVLL